MKRWMIEVQVYGETSYHSNGLRFGTEAEAKAYGSDLFSRWMQVENWRAVPSADEVTHKIENGVMSSIE